MLYRLSRLPTDVLALVVYTDSPSLEYVYLSLIREHFDVSGDYILNIDSEKALTRARSSVNITPLRGKHWLLNIDADKVDIKALERTGIIAYDSCLVLYHTARYGTYKRLIGTKFHSKLGRYCVDLYGGTLDRRDIALIARHYEVSLDENVTKFLEHKYNRTPQSICTLCSLLKSGYSLTSEHDIIEAIGLGSISVDDFVFSVLNSKINTKIGLKRALKQKLIYLSNLAEGISYSSIQNFIVDTLAGLIDIKTAMISGEISILNSNPPSSYTDKRAARFKRLLRYRVTLEKDLSLEYLIYCHSLFKRNAYNPKLAIIEWLLRLYAIEGITETPRQQRIDIQVPIGATFTLASFDSFGNPAVIKQKSVPKVGAKNLKKVESSADNELGILRCEGDDFADEADTSCGEVDTGVLEETEPTLLQILMSTSKKGRDN